MPPIRQLTLQTQDVCHPSDNSLYRHKMCATHQTTHSTDTRCVPPIRQLTLQTQDVCHPSDNSLYRHKMCATHQTTHSTDTRCVPPIRQLTLQTQDVCHPSESWMFTFYPSFWVHTNYFIKVQKIKFDILASFKH